MVNIPEADIAALVASGQQQPVRAWVEAKVHYAILAHLHVHSYGSWLCKIMHCGMQVLHDRAVGVLMLVPGALSVRSACWLWRCQPW